MNSTKSWMTAQTAIASPSDFGMPAAGHVFGVCTAPRATRVEGTTVSAAGSIAGIAADAIVRDREAGIDVVTTDGRTGLAQSNFWGTSAWRPPTC